MPALLDVLNLKIANVFAALDLPPRLAVVRISDRPDLAQFQCNGAMAAGKQMGKNPRDVAAQIIEKLKNDPDFEHLEIAGPGFINIKISDSLLEKSVTAQKNDSRYGIAQIGAGQIVVLDYGGPNAAKAMHVGHLRTAIVGDTLRRILKESGYQTIGDIHLGDWGLQAGMVISELEIRHPDWAYFIPGKTDGFPTTFPLNFDDLSEIYPAASADAKASEARMDQARATVLKLQQGHVGYNALWSNIINMSKKSMQENYGALNVHFDLWKGERDVDPLIPDMVHELEQKNYAVPSEGAIVIPVARNDDKREVPPLILLKSDGAYLYATTDLATIIDRLKTTDHPRPNWCIYVVDQRQGLHFEQVFRAAKLSGIAPAELRLDFAGIGTMNGPDNKPFKTRAGGVLRLQDLIEMGFQKAITRMDEAGLGHDWADIEKNDTAQKIAVAAIKFADLKNPRSVDYIFDLDAMTSFEGKTGPYLLYQAVRIQSILSKAKEVGCFPHSDIQIDDHTRPLALLIVDFPNAIEMTINQLSVHVLADYLHRLAQGFAGFYSRCHILHEPDLEKRNSYLAIADLTLKILTRGLDLMGIEIPKRM